MSDLICIRGWCLQQLEEVGVGQGSKQVRLISHVAATLGEGPVWDAQAGVLWFVDVKGRRVFRFDPARDELAQWDAPGQVGWVVPSGNGLLLAGLQSGLFRFDPANGRFEAIVAVEPDQPTNRLNDATVGPDGVVWFGSMDDGERDQSGRFYRWDGTDVTDTGIQPLCITNGPAVSPDGTTLYYVDTVGGVIHAAEIGPGNVVTGGRVFAQVETEDGHPDGVSVDAEGNVWVGLWGGWSARLYAPDGTIKAEVRLPVANVTKVALGGADLRTAYVTTARTGLDAEALEAQPDAGGLFSFRVDVPGMVVKRATFG